MKVMEAEGSMEARMVKVMGAEGSMEAGTKVMEADEGNKREADAR